MFVKMEQKESQDTNTDKFVQVFSDLVSMFKVASSVANSWFQALPGPRETNSGMNLKVLLVRTIWIITKTRNQSCHSIKQALITNTL